MPPHQLAKFGLPFIHAYIFLWIYRSNIIGARTNQPVVIELLDNVCRPASNSGDSENRREKIYVNSQRVISRSRIKIHIRIELFVSPYKIFDLLRILKPPWVTAGMSKIARHLPQMRCPRILGVINPVS